MLYFYLFNFAIILRKKFFGRFRHQYAVFVNITCSEEEKTLIKNVYLLRLYNMCVCEHCEKAKRSYFEYSL